MERQAKKSAVMVWTETVAIRMTTKAAKRRHWSLRHKARHTSASMRTGWRYILAAPVELIPDAPHRLQQFRLGGVIFDLLAQQADVHVHHALIAEEVVAPDALQQLRPAVDDAGSAGQLAQQVEFQRREVDGCPALADPAARQVDAQRRRVDDAACAIRERAGTGAPAPQHGLHPGHQ